jgi:apolipoprotein N-acyltransferase
MSKNNNVTRHPSPVTRHPSLLKFFLIIFLFSLSFPFVVPGDDYPLWIQRTFGWLFIFPVMPLYLSLIDSVKTTKNKILVHYGVLVPANAFVFYWIFHSLYTFGGLSITYSLTLLFVMFISLGTFWLVFFFLYNFIKKRGKAYPWIVAVFWVMAETIRTFFPVDFYWSALGHSQYNNPVTLQWASIGSIYLLSFMIVWISVYLYHLIIGENRKTEGIVLCSVTAFLLLYSFYQLYSFKNLEPEKEVKVAIMQPSINQYDINSKEKNLGDMINVLREQINSFDKDSDLLVWTEAGMPMRVPHDFSNYLLLWERYFPDTHYFENQIVGLDMIDREKREFYNSSGFVQQGRIQKKYTKIKLAPFGEYLPFGDLLHALGMSTIVPNTVGNFKRGTEHVVYDFGKVKAAILICYDGTLSENVREFVKNGAELFVNITNDAWFSYSSATFQHGSFYPFRAVETGRTIIRAANVGQSGVVLPDGSFTDTTGLFERTTINKNIPIYIKDTFYNKYGNIFLYLLLFTGFVVLFREINSKGAGKK